MTIKGWLKTGAAMLMLLLSNCKSGEEANRQKLFSRLEQDHTGITFSNDLTDDRLQNIIEYLYYYNGGGVAVGDLNNDSLPDLVFTANQKPDELYLNLGGLKFKKSRLGHTNVGNWSTGVTMADVNGDGYLDIHICKVSGYKSFYGHNLLYLNNGDATFTEVSAEVGLDFEGYSTQASFFDFDRDGDLDMYLLNHAVHTRRSYGYASSRTQYDSLSGDRLYENLINEGTLRFKDVTRGSGIYSAAQGYGLGLATSDINGDGWIDIYVGNDFHENDYYYINQQDGTFLESLDDAFQHTSRFSMGVDIADLNGDGLQDLFTLDMLPKKAGIRMKSGGEDNNQITEIKLRFGYDHQYARNTFQLNRGDHTFAEIGQLTNTYATDWSWSVLLQDYDNDGLNDIFISNGVFKRPNDLDYINFLSNITPGDRQKDEESISKTLIRKMPTLKIPNVAFKNLGHLHFESMEGQWGLDEPSYSNGATYADLDNDGDLELIINNINEPAYIYQNNAVELLSNNYLKTDLSYPGFNPFGIGSKVTLYADGLVVLREVSLTRGFQSAVSPTIHFGLGKINVVDSIQVQWPDGSVQVESVPGVNRKMSISYAGNTTHHNTSTPLAGSITTPLPFQYQENSFNDFNREPLIPRKLSQEGPAIAVGDIDLDGFPDLFIGGSHGNPGRMYKQTAKGVFEVQQNPQFEKDNAYEDVAAALADLDEDGDPDLIVASGGSEFAVGSPFLEDRIYLNDGTGTYNRLNISLPRNNGSCIALGDYDGDNDTDLFLGSRSNPGHFGTTPISYLLVNEGNLLFETHELPDLGMVTDARWHDLNNNGRNELIVIGEWMPVTILEFNGNNLVDKTKALGLSYTSGLWRSMAIADLNRDGYADLILGNQGLNSKLKASSARPLTLYVSDFDQNGQTDPVLFHYLGNEQVPLSTRDELVKQIPMLEKKFIQYNSFSEVRSFRDLFDTNADQSVDTKFVYKTESAVFLNKVDSFKIVDLPLEAQFSPINGLQLLDLNSDGTEDLITVGNDFGISAQIGRFDASSGAIFSGQGHGTFQFTQWLTSTNSKQYRHIARVGAITLLFPKNGSPQVINFP